MPRPAADQQRPVRIGRVAEIEGENRLVHRDRRRHDAAAESRVRGAHRRLHVEAGGAHKIRRWREFQARRGLGECDERIVGNRRHAVVLKQRPIDDPCDLDVRYLRPIHSAARNDQARRGLRALVCRRACHRRRIRHGVHRDRRRHHIPIHPRIRVANRRLHAKAAIP